MVAERARTIINPNLIPVRQTGQWCPKPRRVIDTPPRVYGNWWMWGKSCGGGGGGGYSKNYPTPPVEARKILQGPERPPRSCAGGRVYRSLPRGRLADGPCISSSDRLHGISILHVVMSGDGRATVAYVRPPHRKNVSQRQVFETPGGETAYARRSTTHETYRPRTPTAEKPLGEKGTRLLIYVYGK